MPPQNGIKVFIRVKPTKNASGFIKLGQEEVGKVEFNIPHEVASNHVNNTKTNYTFRFDGVIDQEAKQEDVFDRVARDATLNALEGFNATVFAYGQTGSGKTFTITGGAERYVDRGIIPRALSMIFSEIEGRSDVQISAHISYLEIYNEGGYDLLDPSQESKGLEDLPKVSMMEDDEGNVHLKNLSMHHVSCEEDALNLLFLGDTNRAISETPMNLASSRSHCIFTIFLEMRQQGSDVIRRSKLNLVDLAGSERVHKTNSSGQLLREAKAINSSLHFLEMVIVALNERKTKGRQHIPYRNSMMTNVLRDSLGGNCKTSMIATVSAERSNTEESIATCRFAQRVALVENDALVNEELDPSSMIKRLKAEVATLKEEIAFLKGDRETGEGGGDRIDSLEKKRLRTVIQDWLDRRNSESKFAEENEGTDMLEQSHTEKLQPGPLTFERIHACFEILREFAHRFSSSSGTSQNLAHSEAEILSLKQQIQQRDNEIAILVNMVKQGKGVTMDVSGTSHFCDENLRTPPLHSQCFPSEPASFTRTSAASVAPVPSSEVLADKHRALEYFKTYYPTLKAINENKRILKEKYTEAKRTGELVNISRTNINALKQEIEQIRAHQAMRHIVEGDESKFEESKVSVLIDREGEKMKEIEVQKTEYKENFQCLKTLKREIEHIQSLLEKSRTKLQKDFESWYAVMLRQGLDTSVSSTPQTNMTDLTFSSLSTILQQSPPTKEKENISLPESQFHGKLVAVVSNKFTNSHGEDSRSEQHLEGKTNGSTILPTKTRLHVLPSEEREETTSTIPLTGNQEADADILAFYKAKEQLLKRTTKK